MNTLTITAAQINLSVGDIEGNTQKIIDKLNTLTSTNLILFPELSITGYPPEDLLLRPHLYVRVTLALETLKKATEHSDTAIIVGYPQQIDDKKFNMACCIHKGSIIATYQKQKLPNYTVFDEKRYFTPGDEPCVFELHGIKIGLLICEDIWFESPASLAKQHGAQLLTVINASPYDRLKSQARELTLIERTRDVHLPIIYVNNVGGQDELVFDGGSLAVNADGSVAAQAPHCEECDLSIDFVNDALTPQTLPDKLSSDASIYQALVLGVRDYILKNHFPGALIGLSGGIDSALTLAIAADAIGADNVLGVLMPSRYTADMSNEDAIAEAEALGAHYDSITIEPMFNSFLDNLKPMFKDQPVDTTEQNIQARIRGVLLMAISNKFGSIVLTTGNKSEMSVGYATLYGDMAGGFAVLKDVPKTLVYQLARYRNSISPVIPERVITRAPSAELSEDQLDQDSLPDYDTLDAIIDLYVDKDQDPPAIIARGFDEAIVLKVVKMINRNEYKRRQAPPGIRISDRAFGKDRRYPITSGYFK
ncbi:MAG: NAD+ synthase [Coxiella sp. (in: Bacteria)]|nr:MAG: NAD+ synthase [Coxiella sp. (in: g-proteobacteria)]